MVPRKQCIVVHGLPEIRACRVAQETRNDIEKRSSFFKAMVPAGEQIVILKAQRLGPPGTNPPTSPGPVTFVVSDQAARNLLRKSRMFANVFACELVNNSEPTVLVVAYRRPNTPPTDTTTLLRTLTKLFTHRSEYLLFGGFNYPKIDWTTYSRPKKQIQKTNEPTKFSIQ